MPDFITEFKFRDDALPYDPAFTSASFSPYNYLDEIPEDVAVYAVSGWMDGAGYANGVLSRYPHAAQRRAARAAGAVGSRRAGQRLAVARAVEPELPVLGEVLRFFDQHLAGRDTGLDDEDPDPLLRRPCRGMARGEELAAGDGQPAASTPRPAAQLSTAQPNAASADEVQADFTAGSGTQTRYERIAGIDATNYYADWPEREREAR